MVHSACLSLGSVALINSLCRTWRLPLLLLGLSALRCVAAAPAAMSDAAAALAGEALQPMKYGRADAVVDLEVGLWAWPLPCDADGDGDFDLVVSCPDKPYNGVYWFENKEGPKVLMPVFAPAKRLGPTKTYVMPSYDAAGRMRVLSPGFEYLQVPTQGLAEARAIKAPAVKWYRLMGKQRKGPGLRHHQWRLADYNGDGRRDLVVGIEDWSEYGWDDAWDAEGRWLNGPLHGLVFVFLNQGSEEQPDWSGEPQRVLPVDTYGCPSPNFEDFDGDGDLDLLCGEFLDGFTYFENLGSATAPRYSSGRRLHQPDGTELRMALEMIVPVAFDWDRDGDKDLICGDEDGRVALLRNTGRMDAGHSPLFEAPAYFRQQGDDLQFGALVTPVACDWDGDGDTDLLSGNTAGWMGWFENLSGPGVAQPRWAPVRRLQAAGREVQIMAGPNGSIQGPAEAKWGYTTQSVADWDGDGDLDIVFNSILGRVQWLENIGSAKAPRLAAAQPLEVLWQGEPPRLAWGFAKAQGRELLTQWRTTPFAVDWNRDGRMDLIMLDAEGYLAYFERSAKPAAVLLPPRRIFVDDKGKPLQLNAGAAGKSGRRKFCLMDWDGDGKLDLLLNGQNARFWRQSGERDGRIVFEDKGNVSTRNIEGHDTSPTAVDFDGNGIEDLLIGAEDGRFYHLPNPRAR